MSRSALFNKNIQIFVQLKAAPRFEYKLPTLPPVSENKGSADRRFDSGLSFYDIIMSKKKKNRTDFVYRIPIGP
jgi:hypothetical protein